MPTEVEELLAKLAAAEQRADDAEARREDADKQREEEQRRREDADKQREEEQRRREDADKQREEEQRRREEAEIRAAGALPQNLVNFLVSCHGLNTTIKPVTDLSTATQGEAVNPVSRWYPKEILPWKDFPTQQKAVWEILKSCEEIWMQKVYPSQNDLDFLRERIEPVSSEQQLCTILSWTMESMVKDVFSAISKQSALLEELSLRGKVSFENTASFREFEASGLPTSMDELNISSEKRPRKNTRADQYCVLWEEDGTARPLIAVEYKAPHKVTIEEICAGLDSTIIIEKDIMGEHDEDFPYLCKYLMSAVVTQLFSYMIDKGVQHGYICTGEALIFVHIADDPTKVYYNVNVPRRDFMMDSEYGRERTAVAQISAFILQALQQEPPGQEWIGRARATLKKWEAQYDNILARIPVTLRHTKTGTPYEPSPWSNFTRSPIQLRKRCAPATIAQTQSKDDADSSSEEELPESPSVRRQTRSKAAAEEQKQTQINNRQVGNESSKGMKQKSVRIQKRRYCTHKCLLGLYNGRQMDPYCPNARQHGRQHISLQTFLQKVQDQLANDRGADAECCPLYVHGSRGALLKIRLASHGYTFVAKGCHQHDLRHLENEFRIYKHLKALQGRHIPVCCGLMSLELPYFYDGVDLKHILILSWAGIPLPKVVSESRQHDQSLMSTQSQAAQALKAIHDKGVLHCDAEARNIVVDQSTGKAMIIDFERSEISTRKVLGETTPNRNRKRNLGKPSSACPESCFLKEQSLAACSIRSVFVSQKQP